MASLTWTAYGATAYGQLGAAVARAKQGDPLAPVTVLVPTNLAGVIARRHLARGIPATSGTPGSAGRGGVAGLAVLTVDRLAERLSAPGLAGTGRRPSTDAVLAAAWRRALRDDAGVFAPVAEHPATVRALVSAHRELRDVDEAGLAAIGADGGAVAAELVRLHRRVNAGLRERFYDVADLRREAAAGLRARPGSGAGDEIGHVILFLPQDLALGAHALLAELDLEVIAGTTGDERADAAVLRSVRRLGGDGHERARGGEHASHGSLRAVRGGPASPPPGGRPATAHEVVHASDADDEVRCVVRLVMTSLATVPAHRIAVLYGASRPYARLLADHLGAAGLTSNGAGVRPTIERTLPRLLLDLLALPEHGWRRDEVMSVIARATVRTADDHRLPAARWERLSREAGVVAGSDWDDRLAGYAARQRADIRPDQTEGQRQHREREAATADELRGFVATLRAQLERGVGPLPWRERAEWAAVAFGLVSGDLDAVALLPEEEARAAEKIARSLAGMAGLGILEDEADLDALRGTLELELGDDLPRHGTFGRGVLVAPLTESIGLDADVVFVLGLADDLVPGQLDADPLLPEEVRALAGGQLRAPGERIDRQHRHLLAAWAAGARSVASFPRGDLRRSAGRLPSRWLLPTLRVHSGQSTVDASTWQRAAGPYLVGSASYAASITSTDRLASEQEWRVRAAAAAPDDVTAALPGDAVLARGLELARARRSPRLTRFDGDLTGQSVPVPSAAAPASPTALESWARCPHAYFVERLLGVRPVEAPELIVRVSPLDIGSIVHESLDEFHQTQGGRAPDQPWTAAERAELHEITRQVAQRYAARGLTGHPLLWDRELVRIRADLDRLLDDDFEVRSAAGRRQVRSELAFGFGDAPPVVLALPSGREVALRGSADRVDLAGESIVVVDYKTGSSRPYEGLSEENPTGHGSRLQLPVYAHAARAALGRPGTAVSAEYWFVGSRPERIGVALTEQVEQLFLAAVDVIVGGISAGLFPHRPPADDGFGDYIPCQYCDPDGLGAAEHRRRWVRKRTDPRLAGYRALVEPEPVS